MRIVFSFVLILGFSTAIAGQTDCGKKPKAKSLFDIFFSYSATVDDRCKIKKKSCRSIANSSSLPTRKLKCTSDSKLETSTLLDSSSCIVKLTNSSEQYTFRKFTGFGLKACEKAISRCKEVLKLKEIQAYSSKCPPNNKHS